MSSIVLDLQNEVTKPDCDIVNVLRKAHLIAVKLNLTEFDKWITNELNGYKDAANIPAYRSIEGVLKFFNPYHGWCPVIISDTQAEKRICQNMVSNSISEIQNLSAKSEHGLILELSGETQAILNKYSTAPVQTHYRLELSTTAVADIVEKVKNTVLEWTITLEAEGILGDGMQFKPAEKETAKRIPQTVNNYYGSTNVINAPVEYSAVIAGNDNSVEFTYEKAREAVTETEEALDGEVISAEDQETAMEMLAEIKEKIIQEKKPSVIKSALIGLKDFLIGVGASATVAVVDAKMKGLF